MRSTKSLILLVIAAGCGLIAAFGFAQAMSQPKGEAIETETIFVAVDQIPISTKLTAEHVKAEQWPIDKVPEGAARSIEDFEGMSPMYPLVPKEPIVLTKLTEGGNIASDAIPPGHHVMSVKVDKESAMSGLVTPGDKVDVLVFVRGRGTSDGFQTGTSTILRNITVFAVNDQISRDPEAQGTSIDAKTVSLLVLPKQSEILLLARQLGTIHLTLRKGDDDTQIATEGASLRDLFSDSSEGSDGTTETEDTNDSGGLFDILKGMQAGNSKAVDTSTVSDSGGPAMLIMGPDGVIGKYSFGNDPSGLPTELLNAADGGGQQPEASSDSESESGSAEPEAMEGEADPELLDGDLDPSAILGL